MSDVFKYFSSNIEEILMRSFQHFQLTVLSISFAILIGVPLGIAVSYIKQLKKPVMGASNLMQALPSLALLGFLVPLIGIGTMPAVAMSVVYSLLPIIKNTTTGLGSIDKQTIEAAKGIGMTRFQILYKVKLPLALPVIMAGVRIAAVTAVGLVTLASVVGAGGLGFLIYSGIRTVNINQIIAGAVPACIMALLVDLMLALIEKSVTPLSLTPKIKTANSKMIRRFKIRRIIVLIASVALLLGVLITVLWSDL